MFYTLMVKLIIDTREQKIKYLFDTKKIKSVPDINYSIEALDLGDFIFKDEDNNVIIIIERKSITDLNSSIKDGRHKEQKARLLSNYPKEKIIYLLEGNIDYNKVDENIIYGSLLNTQFRDKLQIIKTIDINETHKYLCFLYKKICTKPEFFNNCLDQQGGALVPYEQTIKIKKKDNMTPSLCQIIQLAQIPGISVNISKVILNRYGSLKTLILEFTEHDENMLSEIIIETSTGKNRRIGNVISSKVHKYLVN